MKVIQKVKEMQTITLKLKSAGKTVGFVPTMGYLHDGHLALMKKARAENDIVVASVFVNPSQFGPNEDFDTYPRDFERDTKLARGTGVDYLFYPSAEEMYPDELTVEVKVKKRTGVLCGKRRKGHFDGVATVLIKLFSIVQPDHVYFGLKDAQQVAVVDGLIKDFNLPVTLRPVETVREEDGLAKSSRNVNLTRKERVEAPHLYQSLLKGKGLIESGERNPENVIRKIQAYLEEHVSGTVEYVEIYSYPELEPVDELKGRVIIALAVQFSGARLIDNIIFDLPDSGSC